MHNFHRKLSSVLGIFSIILTSCSAIPHPQEPATPSCSDTIQESTRTIINFDDLPPGAPINHYAGLTWTHFRSVPSEWLASSAPNAALSLLDTGEYPSISAGPGAAFILSGLMASPAWAERAWPPREYTLRVLASTVHGGMVRGEYVLGGLQNYQFPVRVRLELGLVWEVRVWMEGEGGGRVAFALDDVVVEWVDGGDGDGGGVLRVQEGGE